MNEDKDLLRKLIRHLIKSHIMEPKDLARVLGYDLITFIKKYMP